VDPSAVNPLELMLRIIRRHMPKTKWIGAPLAEFRQVANTNRGDIGEEIVLRYLEHYGIPVAAGSSRVSASDIEIFGKRVEVKTASEDVGGSFQFNHVRLDRMYDYLLCLAVRPAGIMFNAWTKGDLSEGKAGTLVRMAEGQSVTFKLTKRPAAMRKIEDLPVWARELVGGV